MSFITLKMLALACQLNASGEMVSEPKCQAATDIVVESTRDDRYLKIVNDGLIDCKKMPEAGKLKNAQIGYAYQDSFDFMMEIARSTTIADSDKAIDAAEFLSHGVAGYLAEKWVCKSS